MSLYSPICHSTKRRTNVLWGGEPKGLRSEHHNARDDVHVNNDYHPLLQKYPENRLGSLTSNPPVIHKGGLGELKSRFS
jgi:hypothetical protein